MSPSGFLALATATLLAGPAGFYFLRRRRGPFSFVDGFVVVAVPGLVLLHIVPEAVAHRDLGLALALVAGLMAPGTLERLTRDVVGRTDLWALALGVSGLAVHAILEGVALRPLSGSEDLAFGLAVALHRIPVGVAIWWLVRERGGDRAALAAVLGVGVLTGIGFWGSGSLSGWVGGAGVELYQAFVGGTLVHVAFHQIGGHQSSPPRRLSTALEGLGGAMALVLLVGLGSLDAAEGGEGALLLGRFLSLATLSAPALLVAWGIAGALGMREGPSPEHPGEGEPRRGRDGVQLTVGLVSIPLLGVGMAALRVVLAGACRVALSKEPRRGASPIEADATDHPGRPTLSGEAAGGGEGTFRAGLEAAVDRDAPEFLTGLLIAAALAPLLAGVELGSLPWPVAVVGGALFGVPWRLGALLVTPSAAVVLSAGLPPGALLAFLATAPLSLRGAAGRGAAASARVLGLAAGAGLVVEGVLQALGWSLSSPTLGVLLETSPRGGVAAAVVIVATLVAGSLVRRGARRFIDGSQVAHLHIHDHDHDHGPHGVARGSGDGVSSGSEAGA